ncbi:T9SS type A sorting domain-containing protein [Algibacter sp. 2305UL17-15]|uniref:T9SS type A sorting domain-containing protein n=1 Tax=Algibacter sp. 2305UL17-15 TaxID=3231268 RepID=UPI003457FD5C
MKTKLLVLLLLGFALSLKAQIRFIEVNTSTNIIKIKNFGASTIDIGSYQLCDFPAYPALNTLTVTSGSLNLAAGAEVTVDISSGITMNTANGELGLYIGGPFGTASNMRDYIQWGSPGHTRENVANNALIWVTGTFISPSAPLPYQYTGNGATNNDGVAYWDPTLSIEDFDTKTKFSLFPNPVASKLNLKFSNNTENETITIYNLLGEIVLRKESNTNNFLEMDVSGLSSGLYMVRVNTTNKRFVKQ